MFESSSLEAATLDEHLRQAIERIGPLSVSTGHEVGGREHLRTAEQQKVRAVALEATVALKVVHLAAFRRFAESLTRASDRFALLALYFDAVGAPQNASDARMAALAATPADAHEFMTELQISWSSLIERAMLAEALELLLENYPRVPRRDLDEVNELIRQTFRHHNAASNGHSGPRERSARRRSH
ncbi:MAG TPA: hypothetical protein PK867_02725 [Pirellulales bacterium]|nr:hypothetical protein [Pirellulales bacterium]